MIEKNNNLDTLDISLLKTRIFKEGKVLFIRHLLGFTINFSGSIILARFLGPEILGLYFISYTIFVILRQLIDFGISIHLIRIPSKPDLNEIQVAFTTQQILSLLIVTITIIVISLVATKWYGEKELSLLIISAAIGAYFNSWQSIPLSQLEKNIEYQKVGIIEVTEILTFNLIAIIGVVIGIGIWGLVLGNIFRGFFPALIAILLTGLRPRFLKDRKAVFSLMHTSAPIVGSNLLVWIIMLAPAVIVGSIAGTKALGIAQLTYTVLGYTGIILTIFQRISLCAFSKIQTEPILFNNTVNKSLRLLAVIYIPLTMIIASLSPSWIPIVYGKKWEGMEKVMLIAALPISLSGLFSIPLSALLAKGYAKLIFKQNLLHGIIYWIIMAISASSLKSISVPLSHLIAISAGYLFIYGYNKYCGKLYYRPIISLYLINVTIMSICWYIAINNHSFIAFFIWTIFLVFLFFSHRVVKESIFVFN